MAKNEHTHVINWQRVEGLAMFCFFTFSFYKTGIGWWWYALLLFSFDISMLGYLYNNKVGAFFYNVGHTTIAPIAVLFIGHLCADKPLITAVGFVWLVHIGMDRVMGYGLKLQKGFKHTHLGIIGKKQF